MPEVVYEKCPNCKSPKIRPDVMGFVLCLNCGLVWKFVEIPTAEEEERRTRILKET